jgi:hypothetical protein
MSKNKRKSFDVKSLVANVKSQLDPKTRATKVRFNNETGNRLGGIYTLVIGTAIIVITASTVILPIKSNYPFNYTQSEKVRSSIVVNENKSKDLDKIIKDARQYEDTVNKEKKRIEEMNTTFLPSKIDSLSFMVYSEQIAKKHNILVEKLVLPENRRSAVVTGNIDVTKSGNGASNNLNPTTTTPTKDTGTTLGTSGVLPSNQTTNGQPAPSANPTNANGATTPATPATDTPEEKGYVIDLKIVGMYTELSAFMKDLESTKELIQISDVKIEEYKPENIGADGKPIVDNTTDAPKIDLSNFDMKKIKTQITFKVALFDQSSLNADSSKDSLLTPTNSATPSPTASPNAQETNANNSTGVKQ